MGDRKDGSAGVRLTEVVLQPCAAEGWGRGNGRGIPDDRFVAGTADARSKIGTASDAYSVMRYPTRESELDHRRLYASSPPLCIHLGMVAASAV